MATGASSASANDALLSGLSPLQAQLITVNEAIADDLRNGNLDAALARAPGAVALAQRIDAPSSANAFSDAVQRVSGEISGLLRAYNDSPAGQADPLAATRAFKTILISQMLQITESLAGPLGFPWDPRDTQFPGVDSSPVPPLCLPLPDVAADSPWAKFDANGYIEEIVCTAALAAAETTAAFRGMRERLEPGSEIEKLANDARMKLDPAVLHLLSMIMLPRCGPMDEIDYIARYFVLDDGETLPTDRLSERAWSTLALAIFPRIYPLLRALIVEFVSLKSRRAWNSLDPTRLPGTLLASPERIVATEEFINNFEYLYEHAAYSLRILVASRACARRLADDPRLLGALVDAAAMCPHVVAFLYTNPQSQASSETKAPTPDQLKGELKMSLGPFLFATAVHGSQWAQFCRTKERRSVWNPMVSSILLEAVQTASWDEEHGSWFEALEPTLQELLGPNVPSKRELVDGQIEVVKQAGRIPDRCDGCGRFDWGVLDSDSALRRCSRCKIARYCSAECQRNVWKAHKNGCTDVPPLNKEVEEAGPCDELGHVDVAGFACTRIF